LPECVAAWSFQEIFGLLAFPRRAGWGEWCLQVVDVCWEMKQGKIREHERATAAAAFEVARQAYRPIRDESFDDREK
jgi:hypothetical protein